MSRILRSLTDFHLLENYRSNTGHSFHRRPIAAPSDFYFAWQIAWRVALLVAGKLLSFWRADVGNWYFALLILAGLTFCARGLLAERSAARRWAVYLFVCPLLAIPAFLFDRPYYDLTLGMLALTMLADRLATHRLFSDTSRSRTIVSVASASDRGRRHVRRIDAAESTAEVVAGFQAIIDEARMRAVGVVNFLPIRLPRE